MSPSLALRPNPALDHAVAAKPVPAPLALLAPSLPPDKMREELALLLPAPGMACTDPVARPDEAAYPTPSTSAVPSRPTTSSETMT